MFSFRSTLILICCTMVIGCGGGGPAAGDPAAAQRKQELTEIHEMYVHFLKSQRAAPKQLSDLTKKTYEGSHPMGVETLKKGKYIFVFGVEDQNSGTLLAYEKDAPTNGGAVLMADGTVKFVNADEFKALKPGK